MKQSQVEHGKALIASVAEEWGVTIEQAARILELPTAYYFFKWVNASEFLEQELWRDECHGEDSQ